MTNAMKRFEDPCCHENLGQDLQEHATKDSLGFHKVSLGWPWLGIAKSEQGENLVTIFFW